MLLEKE
jgi:phosphoenolpyruvate synthase/pyruvate phosphate dikinase